LRGAHIAPVSAVDHASQTASSYCTSEERKERETPLGTTPEELGAINTDTGIREAVRVALHDPITLQTEVSARMVRGVRNQHESRMRIVFQFQPSEVEVRPHIAV